MHVLSRVTTVTALLIAAGCAGSEGPSLNGEPIGTEGSGDDDGDGSTSANPTAGSSDPSDPTTDPTADETGGCGGCLDASGVCQPGSFNEACGVLGEACQPCAGSTVCAEGACVEPPQCGPENCDGCCDGDTCLDGDAEDQCGRGGAQCNTCPSDATCDAGICNLSCADSCDGCCDGETCVELDTLSDQSCGTGGAVCETCGSGFECIDGECLSTACIATCDGCCDGSECLGGGSEDACGSDGMSCQQCGLHTVCEASGCVPDPMALWDIVIHDGVIALTDVDGYAWDSFNGLPDPYVTVEVVGMYGETDYVDDTVFPTWEQTVLTGVTTVQLQGDVQFSVVDSDIGFDTTLATCTVSIEDDMFGDSFSLTCSDGDYDLWQVTFSIDPA